MDKIVAVYAMDVDRNYLLGYVCGGFDKIEEYFNSQKAYGLLIEEVHAVNLDEPIFKEKIKLEQEQKEIKERLSDIERKLKQYKNLCK